MAWSICPRVEIRLKPVKTELLQQSQQVEKPNPPTPFPTREGGAGNLTKINGSKAPSF